LLPVKTENDVVGFKRTTIKINDEEYEAFQSEADDSFYLIFAMNVATGEEDYYIFDNENNLFVKYNSKAFEKILTDNKEFKLYTIALGGASIVLFLLLLIVAGKNSKFKKIIKRLSSQKESLRQKEPETIQEEKDELDDTEVEEEIREEEVKVDEDFEAIENKKKRKKKH